MSFTSSQKVLRNEIESLIETLASSEKVLDKLPPGVTLRIRINLWYDDKSKLEPNTRPSTVGEVFSQLSFFYCGYQKSAWERITAAVDLEENGDRDVLDFLKRTTEKDLLRTPGWGKKSLYGLYDVLHWHGYTETFQQTV